MQLGVDGVFVGSGIFKSNKPKERAHAMVQAVTHYKDAAKLAEVSENLGVPMVSASRELAITGLNHLGNWDIEWLMITYTSILLNRPIYT